MKARLAIGFALVIAGAAATFAERPATWAQPVSLDGVPNLHAVSPQLYRSAQPTAQGMRNLKQMGVATVVCLRSFHSDQDEIGETELMLEQIDLRPWHPGRKDIARFLRIVTDPARTPVLVHCQYGADRTGTLCALYRVAVQDWSKEAAIREMTQGGFGYHKAWRAFSSWIAGLDIEAIRREAGISVEAQQLAGRAAPPGDFP